MKCASCNTEAQAGNLFCGKCGTKIEGVTDVNGNDQPAAADDADGPAALSAAATRQAGAGPSEGVEDGRDEIQRFFDLE